MSDDLKKIPYSPSGLQVRHGQTMIRTILDGGVGRYRKDQLHASTIAAVSFELDDVHYDSFFAFIDLHTNNQADPFLIELLIKRMFLRTYEARIIPGSLITDEFVGVTGYVSAELEITPCAGCACDDYFDSLTIFIGCNYDCGGTAYDNFCATLGKLANLFDGIEVAA